MRNLFFSNVLDIIDDFLVNIFIFLLKINYAVYFCLFVCFIYIFYYLVFFFFFCFCFVCFLCFVCYFLFVCFCFDVVFISLFCFSPLKQQHILYYIQTLVIKLPLQCPFNVPLLHPILLIQ